MTDDILQNKISIEKEPKLDDLQEDKILSLKHNYIDSVEEMTNRKPLDELNSIKEKIKNENIKIKEINTKLDQLNNLNSQTLKKRNLDSNNINLLTLSYPKSLNANKLNSISVDRNSNLIHEKMKNLRKMRIERVNTNENKNNNIDDILNLNKNKSISIENSSLEKRILAMEEEEKKSRQEMKKKYENKVKLFRERELEMEKQRKNIINKINNISLSQINKYSPKKNYITSEEKEEMRKQKEESLYHIENQKRKLKYIPISSEELNTFSNEVRKNEKLLKSELAKKKKQMEELWKERKNLLPKYHSKFMDLNIELDNEAKDEIILKQEKIKNKRLQTVNFGKDIAKNHQPKILNDKLKLEREQRIKELEGSNRINNIKELGSKIRLKKNKIIQSQPKKFKTNNVFVPEESTKEKQAKKLTGIPEDYLLNYRNEKAKIDNIALMQNNSAEKVKKWKEILNNEDNNLYDKVENIKIQAAIMENKAKSISKLLKNGGSVGTTKQELNQEASNLYINSIHAKLQILNKMLNQS